MDCHPILHRILPTTSANRLNVAVGSIAISSIYIVLTLFNPGLTWGPAFWPTSSSWLLAVAVSCAIVYHLPVDGTSRHLRKAVLHHAAFAHAAVIVLPTSDTTYGPNRVKIFVVVVAAAAHFSFMVTRWKLGELAKAEATHLAQDRPQTTALAERTADILDSCEPFELLLPCAFSFPFRLGYVPHLDPRSHLIAQPSGRFERGKGHREAPFLSSSASDHLEP